MRRMIFHSDFCWYRYHRPVVETLSILDISPLWGYNISNMYRPKNTQERILHRLKIAQGHLKKVLKMVEEDCYCIDVLYQSQAVQKALKEIDNLMLENHLQTCASDAIGKGKKDEAIVEVMEVFKRMS